MYISMFIKIIFWKLEVIDKLIVPYKNLNMIKCVIVNCFGGVINVFYH